MVSGVAKKRSIWDRYVAELQERETAFRMEKQSKGAVIRIREFRNGQMVDKFSWDRLVGD